MTMCKAIRHAAAYDADARFYNASTLAVAKAHARPARPDKGATFSRFGIEKLVREAAKVSGFTALPYNLSVHGPWVGYRVAGSHYDPCKGMIEVAARFSGWLKAASGFPLLARVINEGLSPKGMTSPHTVVDVYTLARCYPSPGMLNRRLGAVRARANVILRPFGRKVPLSVVAQALHAGSRGSIGKQATIAAYHHVNNLHPFHVVSYRTARNGLAARRATPPEACRADALAMSTATPYKSPVSIYYAGGEFTIEFTYSNAAAVLTRRGAVVIDTVRAA